MKSQILNPKSHLSSRGRSPRRSRGIASLALAMTLMVLAILIFPLIASAQEKLPETGFEKICSKELGLATCVQQLYVFALGLGALVALLMLVLAGYRYMTAAGNATLVQNAKDAFTSAFTGLVIIFIAFILLYLINPDLTKFKNFSNTLALPEIKKPASTNTPDADQVVTGGDLTGGGKPPVVNAALGITQFTMREMDLRSLQVLASDPEGDPLTYEWAVETDPTGGKAQFYEEKVPERRLSQQLVYDPPEFLALGKSFRSNKHFTVFFGIQEASPKDSLRSVFDGKQIIVRVNVSDGTNTSSLKYTITVNGHNRPPTHKFKAGTALLGTPNSRLTVGTAQGGGAYKPPDIDVLSDPDGGGVSTQWFWGNKTGGEYLGNTICTSCEGGSPSFSIPNMTAPIDQKIYLASRDGLHLVKTEFTAYLAPKAQ